MAGVELTMAGVELTMAGVELTTVEGVRITGEGVPTMRIALVETEVGTTEDMEAESAVGLLVATEGNREVIGMGLQECQPRASPLLRRGSTPAARVRAIAATPLVHAPLPLQVLVERPMMAEVAALTILAVALPTGMRTAVEVAAGAARMTGELPPTSTQVVEVAAVVHRAMGAAVDMEIRT
mmetsp:Transcript_17262/g.36473  ORF Transcript_17262/g.36473 Transcript_17262/m.36473 type:complete len:182 (-) Transcript_17262:630-1175(-)